MKISSKTIRQFALYNLGGFLYFWSAWLIITFGTEHIGLWWANLAGNLVGIALNYLVQRFWAFGVKDNKNLFKSGWKFTVLTIANILIGYTILRLLTSIGIPLWLAQFGNAGFFTIWNWLWYRHWVFKK